MVTNLRISLQSILSTKHLPFGSGGRVGFHLEDSVVWVRNILQIFGFERHNNRVSDWMQS